MGNMFAWLALGETKQTRGYQFFSFRFISGKQKKKIKMNKITSRKRKKKDNNTKENYEMKNITLKMSLRKLAE